jgi:hypothetical protein
VHRKTKHRSQIAKCGDEKKEEPRTTAKKKKNREVTKLLDEWRARE